jgi:RND superfamily putative drug exporter
LPWASRSSTGCAQRATIEALGSTGRIINAAAAVMITVFLTFALVGPIPLKEMGLVLAVAVLLDAMLVRLVLLPVVLRLLGHRAWWVPGWLDRLLPHLQLSHDTQAPSTGRPKVATARGRASG